MTPLPIVLAAAAISMANTVATVSTGGAWAVGVGGLMLAWKAAENNM